MKFTLGCSNGRSKCRVIIDVMKNFILGLLDEKCKLFSIPLSQPNHIKVV